VQDRRKGTINHLLEVAYVLLSATKLGDPEWPWTA